MYTTSHSDGKTKGRINYTVWSEVFSCPECGEEVTFLIEALDKDTKRTRDLFPCPSCKAQLTKKKLQRNFETLVDPVSGDPWRRIHLRPVLINYSVGKARYEKEPDFEDFEKLERIADLRFPSEIPTDALPIDTMYHGSRLAPKGFTHVHHLFLPRAERALAAMWQRVDELAQGRLRNMLLFMVEQAIGGMSVLNRYGPSHYSQVNRQLSGVYYVSSQIAEVSLGTFLPASSTGWSTPLNPDTRELEGQRFRAETATIQACPQIRLTTFSLIPPLARTSTTQI